MFLSGSDIGEFEAEEEVSDGSRLARGIQSMLADPKPVAAVVTEYRQNSHADVIVGRILEGYNFDGRSRPELQLASLYTDQVPANDWSRALAKKHGVLICDSIDGAITLGSGGVAVEGVLVIGEHGNYPLNEKGQQMYPRRRFFEQVAAAFEKNGRSVPVFNDKHLAYDWADAEWMYDRSRELMIPFMAGSSLPVTWRRPALHIRPGTRMSAAVAVAYGPTEAYGFHALEMLQCMVERRRGGEQGVVQVQLIEGPAVWQWLAGRHNDEFRKLLDAALRSCPAAKPGSPQANCDETVTVFLVDYCDDLRAAVFLLNGHVQDFAFAARLHGLNRGAGIRSNVAACNFYLEPHRPYSHFAHLVHAIEQMILTGHPSYPVERTLLTTGLLDALMTSRHEGQRPVNTEELAIRYEPVDYPFATDPLPG